MFGKVEEWPCGSGCDSHSLDVHENPPNSNVRCGARIKEQLRCACDVVTGKRCWAVVRESVYGHNIDSLKLDNSDSDLGVYPKGMVRSARSQMCIQCIRWPWSMTYIASSPHFQMGLELYTLII